MSRRAPRLHLYATARPEHWRVICYMPTDEVYDEAVNRLRHHAMRRAMPCELFEGLPLQKWLGLVNMMANRRDFDTNRRRIAARSRRYISL